jgi:hypothetical protein
MGNMSAHCDSDSDRDVVYLLYLLCSFLSVATVYLPSAIPVSVVCQSGTDENRNFLAVRCRIGLKLGGDLGLVSQINLYVLVSRFDCFLYF